MSELARLLQQYGYGEQPNPLAQDGVTYDTSNVLAGMPRPNALADALRTAASSIPENKEASLSMLNMVRGGLGTAANWLEGRPEIGKDTLAPLGAGLMGSAFAPQNALGIFGGRLAKTADHNALAKAEELAAKGADRKAIWDQTGWFQGADGKWRFEIDDSKSRISDSAYKDLHSQWEARGREMPSGLEHDTLYGAYPQLREAAYHYTLNPTDFGGSGALTHDLRMDAKGFSYPSPGAPGLVSAEAASPKKLHSIAMHELQHAVQRQEGFAPGGNPESMANINSVEAWRERLPYLVRKEMEDRGLERLRAGPELDAIKESIRQRISDELGQPFQYRHISRDVGDEMTYAVDLARNMSLPQLQEMTLQRLKDLGRTAYENLPGEREARNVQTRMNFTPTERRARPPWETE
jgi:hypothetical protein